MMDPVVDNAAVEALTRTALAPREITASAEAVISLGASAVLVSASTAALSTTGSIISHTGEKTSLRQNASGGLRLLGSEVQRGLHLLIKTIVLINKCKPR